MPDDLTPKLLAQLQEEPEDWALRARICDALLLEGRVGEAVSLVDTAPQPPQYEAHVLKAAEVYGQARPEKAVPLLYHYLESAPSSALAHLAMAEAAIKLHQLATAQSYYERALELNPGYRDPEFEQRHGIVLTSPPPGPSALPTAALPAARRSTTAAAGDPPAALPVATPAGKRADPALESTAPRDSVIPSWAFIAIIALATFLLCWMLLGLALRAALLQTVTPS